MRLERLNNLPLNTVTPDFVAIFVFFGTAFSFIETISFSETEAKREAILFLFGCSEVNSTWIITSGLTNQRAPKELNRYIEGAVEFLRHLGLLFKAFSIHLKHQKAQKLSLDEAISEVEMLDNLLKETVENVMTTFEKPCRPSDSMGTVSSQTLSSVHMILE